MILTDNDQARLAQIRMHNLIASSECDTTFWESTFFLRIIDDLIKELK